MTEMSSAEAVVASRFHNIVCALLLAKPTVSVAYAAKNDELMQAFGLGAACQSLDHLDVQLLRVQLDQVLREHSHREVVMQATLNRYEVELEAQFRQLSREFLGHAPDRLSVMT
jgi:polysaccharide pyruvyl transferase WcaK-like protein